MELKKPINDNYAAVVVTLKTFVDLPNCDNVKAAIVFGTQVIVGRDQQPGDVGLYFPPETALSAEFLAANNLYRKAEYGNSDPAAKGGYFEQAGRVRTVKFRGHASQGIWLPIDALAYLGSIVHELHDGSTFDTLYINDSPNEICHKYVSRRNPGRACTNQPKQKRVEDRIVEGQFAFHYDTANLRRNIQHIQPSDYIAISDKWHGTSVVIARLPIKRELRWWEKLASRFVDLQTTDYGLVWSSRKVIKGVGGESKSGVMSYYDSDVYGEIAAAVEPMLADGVTVYGEIVGFTKTGSAIQKEYAYGCDPANPIRHNRLVVYRVTVTTPDGKVFELPWPEMIDWCLKRGIEPVKELFYGKACDLIPTYGAVVSLDSWQDAILDRLEQTYVHDQDCAANPGLPAEGIVVRVERGGGHDAFKLKNFRFLERETKLLDQGVEDVETLESEGASNEVENA